MPRDGIHKAAFGGQRQTEDCHLPRPTAMLRSEYRFEPAPLPEPVLVFLRAVEPVVDDRAWMTDAACCGKPTELFFPSRGERDWMDGKELCAGCSVRAECLDYAVDNGIMFGVWGGLSEGERRRLRVGQRTESRAS